MNLKDSQKGVAVYLAVIVMFLLLGIGIGLGTILIGQIRVFQRMGDSVVAIYAADTGIERELYETRGPGGTPKAQGTIYSGSLDIDGDGTNDASYQVTIKSSSPYTVESIGMYKGVRRAVEIKLGSPPPPPPPPPPPQFTLIVTKLGTGIGTVTSSPAGINCPGDCEEAYDSGTNVTLTANPDANSTFDGWSGAADCPNVTMDIDKSCTATFTLLPPPPPVATVCTSPGTVVDPGPSQPGCNSGARPWASPDNAKASDNLFAFATLPSFNSSTNCIIATNFGFAIPATATINGILVKVERFSSDTSVRDATIRLVQSGAMVGNDNIVRATGLDWPQIGTVGYVPDTYVSYGGASDLWGLFSLTPADINNANFGVGYAGWNTAFAVGTANIDHICMEIHYTAP